MPKGLKGWAIWGGFQIALTLVLKLIYRLAENAMMGWGDDQIARWLGIASPTATTVAEWAIPFALAAFILWLYHLIQVHFLSGPTIYTIGNPQGAIRKNIISQTPRRLYAHALNAEKTLGKRVIIAWVLIIASGTGLIVGILLLATNRSGSDANVGAVLVTGDNAPPALTNEPVSKKQITPQKRRMTAYDLTQRQKALDAVEPFIDEIEKSPASLPINQFNWERSFQRGGTDQIMRDLSSLAQELTSLNDQILAFKNQQRYPEIATIIIPLDLGSRTPMMSGMTNDLRNLRNTLRDIGTKHQEAQPDFLRARDYFGSWDKYTGSLRSWPGTTRKAVRDKRREYEENIEVYDGEKN